MDNITYLAPKGGFGFQGTLIGGAFRYCLGRVLYGAAGFLGGGLGEQFGGQMGGFVGLVATAACNSQRLLKTTKWDKH